jgi:hypothetical protein
VAHTLWETFSKLGFVASALGISSYIDVVACLVHNFFISDVESPAFGGAIALCTLIRSSTHLALSFVTSSSPMALCSLQMFMQQ